MPYEVIEAIEHLCTLVRDELCDDNFEWTQDDLDMPDWIAHAYEQCDVVENYLRSLENECES